MGYQLGKELQSPPVSFGSAVLLLVILELFQLNAEQMHGFYSHMF